MLPALGQQDVVAIDGKTSRRSGKIDATALHLVSAFAGWRWAGDGPNSDRQKSNEKTAIPALLHTLSA